MSFTIHGSAAGAFEVAVLTNQEFADEFGGEEPFEDDAQELVVVLVDAGNCLAYAIEGNSRELTEFGHSILNAADEMRRRQKGEG